MSRVTRVTRVINKYFSATDKHIISETKAACDPDCLTGTLSDVSAYINELILKYGMDAKLEWESDRWLEYDDSPSPTFWIKVDRLETDKELKARLDKYEEVNKAQEMREKAEYERLKQKFKE